MLRDLFGSADAAPIALDQMEYYLREKLYGKSFTDEQGNKIIERCKWGLVNAGDPVGLKSALCMGEALTQAALNAIHSIGGGMNEEHIVRSAGIDRFQELFTGINAKSNVLTINLYDNSYESCIKFANSQETFYFKEILVNAYLMISSELDKHVVEWASSDQSLLSLLRKEKVNYWYVYAIINMSRIADYGIHITSIIKKLMENYSEIAFITGTPLNRTQFGAYIYFRDQISGLRIQLILESFLRTSPQTIIHGGCLKNCFVRKLRRMNEANEATYLIEANDVNGGVDETSLMTILFDPRVNPFGTHTTNMNTTLSLFGVCECTARLHEEILYTATNLSDTKEILPRHYKMLADNITSSGTFKYANRNSLKRASDMDSLKLIAFETPVSMTTHSLKRLDTVRPVLSDVSASTFGTLPKLGTGISEVILQ